MIDIDVFLNKYSSDELIKIATRLDKEFRVNYFWDGWSFLQEKIFSEDEIRYLKKHYKYNEVYNHIIMKYGKSETIIKYNLLKQFKNDDDLVALMEYNVGNSRLDIGKIDKYSYAYEIKTELDNILRLEKQISDYEKLFEYIYVVCHKKHINDVRKVISNKIGIIIYEINDEKVQFRKIRKAVRNRSIRKEFLLEAFTAKEYEYIIKNYLKLERVPFYKEDRIKLVNRKIKKQELIEIYKKIIKLRQEKKWDYIKNKFDAILPIEIQDLYSKQYDY